MDNSKENSEPAHLTSGIEANEGVRDDMMNAEENALGIFIKDQMESNETDMFLPIPKMKLKMFESQKGRKSCKINNKTLTLKADRDVFARLLVISKKREVSIEEGLTYSLGPIPWSLATADGGQ